MNDTAPGSSTSAVYKLIAASVAIDRSNQLRLMRAVDTVSRRAEPSVKDGRPSDGDSSTLYESTANLRRRTLSALGGTSVVVVIDRILQIGFVVVLARQLSPQQTAVAAAAGTVVGMIGLINAFGVPPYLIQAPDLTPTKLAHARATLLAAGLAAIVGVEIFAPAAGAWFRNPQVTIALRVIAPILLAPCFAASAVAGLSRELRARDVALSDLMGNLAGTALLTIPLAFAGAGFWALIVGSLVQITTRTMVLCLFARQKIGFKFDLGATAHMWRSSAGYMLNAFLGHADTDAPKWIVGHYLARGDLGLFSRANSLTSFPAGLFNSAVDRVIFPAISLVRGQKERLRAVALDGVQLTAVVGLPLTVALVLLGAEVIRVVLGHKWEGAIAPFRILCFVTYFRLSNRVNWVILRGLGRPYRLALMQGLSLIVLVGGSLWGARAGLAGVTLAVAGVAAFGYVIMAVSAMAAAGVSLAEWVRSQLQGAACALLAMFVLWPISSLLEHAGAAPIAVLAACAAAALLSGALAVRLAPAVFIGRAGGRLLSAARELVSRRNSI